MKHTLLSKNINTLFVLEFTGESCAILTVSKGNSALIHKAVVTFKDQSFSMSPRTIPAWVKDSYFPGELENAWEYERKGQSLSDSTLY